MGSGAELGACEKASVDFWNQQEKSDNNNSLPGSVALILREIQIKTTKSYHYPSVRMAN